MKFVIFSKIFQRFWFCFWNGVLTCYYSNMLLRFSKKNQYLVKGEILARFKAVPKAVFCNHKTKKYENHAKKPLTHWLGTYQGALEKLGEYIREKFTGGSFPGASHQGGICPGKVFLTPLFNSFLLIFSDTYDTL